MKKIIAFFKRLFGVKAEVIVIPEPTKKKRKPRNKRKPKVTEDMKKPILNEEPKKKRKPRPKRKPKPRTDGGEPYVSGSGRQHHNKK